MLFTMTCHGVMLPVAMLRQEKSVQSSFVDVMAYEKGSEPSMQMLILA